MKIWIVGPPGSGKTTLAKQVAARFGFPTLDSDDCPPGTPDPSSWLAKQVSEIVDGVVACSLAVPVGWPLVVWMDVPLAACFDAKPISYPELAGNGVKGMMAVGWISRPPAGCLVHQGPVTVDSVERLCLDLEERCLSRTHTI